MNKSVRRKKREEVTHIHTQRRFTTKNQLVVEVIFQVYKVSNLLLFLQYETIRMWVTMNAFTRYKCSTCSNYT